MRVECRSFPKLTSRFVFLSTPLQSQSKLKMCRRIAGHGVNRRAKLRNRAFEITGGQQPLARIGGEQCGFLTCSLFAEFDFRLRFCGCPLSVGEFAQKSCLRGMRPGKNWLKANRFAE